MLLGYLFYYFVSLLKSASILFISGRFNFGVGAPPAAIQLLSCFKLFLKRFRVTSGVMFSRLGAILALLPTSMGKLDTGL